MKPALLVTGHAPPERVGAFAALAEREDVVIALFGGRALHALNEEAGAALPFVHERPSQRGVHALAASGRFRAVICGTGGRTALPAAYLGARRADVPFVLWSSLWAHPRSFAGAAGWPVLRAIYSRADAVVTYGPHVSRYVRARGARTVFEAPQAVDASFWGADVDAPDRRGRFQALFVGRPGRQKGLDVLLDAWRRSGIAGLGGVLVLVGPDMDGAAREAGVQTAGQRSASQLRNLYAGSDVLTVPSVPTPTVLETWGLVVNEAMHQRTPVIATDAVGAAAGGLVLDGRNGAVVPAGDPGALALALRALHDDPEDRARRGERARADVAGHTFAAWAGGFDRALGACGVARGVASVDDGAPSPDVRSAPAS